MGKEPGLADAIRASATETQYGPKAWWRKIPPDALEDLKAIRRELHSGELSCSKEALAKSISEQLNARNLSTVRASGVKAWLSERD